MQVKNRGISVNPKLFIIMNNKAIPRAVISNTVCRA
nr:MAG TPA: hypothetical protein [Caudoviricetes sp.]